MYPAQHSSVSKRKKREAETMEERNRLVDVLQGEILDVSKMRQMRMRSQKPKRMR